MFWDKGYAPSQNIELLLEKENVTVEEFLDEDDILQECKTLKKNLVNYFTRPDVVKRLIQLITTEPPEELPMALRFRHANMACEILTLDLPSLDEKILSDADTLNTLYSYLENEPPLNPLLSSFFSKTFGMLFKKKAEIDWFLYQQMCLQLLEYIKSKNNFVHLILKHFATPVIPDLLMQMLKDIEGGALKRNLYEWLASEQLVKRLILIFTDTQQEEKFSNVVDFFVDLVQQGRSMRQNESENDSFEPAFSGSNPILKDIESAETIEALLDVILDPKALESAVIAGIRVVLTIIKPAVFPDDPYSDRGRNMQNRENMIHAEVLKTVIEVIEPRLADINRLLSNPPYKSDITTTAGTLSPPFGMFRLQVCRLFRELLQTRDQVVTTAICETDFLDNLLSLFKQYCWNNFLHCEVEKCVQVIFSRDARPNVDDSSPQGSTIIHNLTNDDLNFDFFKSTNTFTPNGLNAIDNFDCMNDNVRRANNAAVGASGASNSNSLAAAISNSIKINGIGSNDIEDANVVAAIAPADDAANENNANIADKVPEIIVQNVTEAATTHLTTAPQQQEQQAGATTTALPCENADSNACSEIGDSNQNVLENDAVEPAADKSNVTEEKQQKPAVSVSDNEETISVASDRTTVISTESPSALQQHAIVECKIVTKLIDCWLHNEQMQSVKKRRLGYMGHLIRIFNHITSFIKDCETVGALIESQLSEEELLSWQKIVNPQDGEFTQAITTQRKLLAGCNAHEAADFSQHLPKEFLTDSNTDYFENLNLEYLKMLQSDSNSPFDDYQRDADEEDDYEDQNNSRSLFFKPTQNALETFGVTKIPWYAPSDDPFENLKSHKSDVLSDPAAASTSLVSNWDLLANDNFADFETHFSTFENDLGMPIKPLDETDANAQGNAFNINATAQTAETEAQDAGKESNISTSQQTLAHSEEYDNNANVERSKLALSIEEEANATNALVAATSTRLVLADTDDEDELADDDDDNGIWTKTVVPQNEAELINNVPAVTNGPSKLHAPADNDMHTTLNNATDAELTAKITNAIPTEFKQQTDTEAPQSDEKKICLETAGGKVVAVANDLGNSDIAENEKNTAILLATAVAAYNSENKLQEMQVNDLN